MSVLSVPADEGFWIGTSQNDRVWVQIVGKGESPYQVQAGDKVDFTARSSDTPRPSPRRLVSTLRRARPS